jgi:hypothetical protein
VAPGTPPASNKLLGRVSYFGVGDSRRGGMRGFDHSGVGMEEPLQAILSEGHTGVDNIRDAGGFTQFFGPVWWFPVLVFAGVAAAAWRYPAWRFVFRGRGGFPGGGVSEPVVSGAGLSQVGDAGGSALMPGLEVVRYVVQGLV